MTTLTCPAADALRQYAIGDCSDDRCEQIERHLAACPACEETVAQFDSADDTLTRHLPLVAANRSPGHMESPPWLDRLRNRPPNSRMPQAAGHAPAPHATPGEGIANYELLRVLGQGGMGVVYLARHKQLNRRVAVKVLSSRMMASAEAQSRFLREIQLLGGLNHAGIVMATDAGTAHSGAYLVMELVDGADLATIVRRSGPLSVAHACEVARQVAEALAAAHAVGVIHRDVKPSNVMFDRQQGRVRLLDFGLARLATPPSESEDTSVGRLLGTLDYMSPEQAKGEQTADERADLYGLGATLYFLLTGQPPHGSHAGRPLLAHLAAITQETPPRVSALRADVPAELDDFLGRLLDSDPAERPDSAAAVAEELSRWAGGDLAARVAELPSVLDDDDEPNTNLATSPRSLADLLAAPSSPDDQAALASSRRGTGSGWVRLTAVTALAAAVWFGVTILLTTPDGTLRIESEADNVQVTIVDEENQSRELQIKRGTNETELRAGKYRVRLAGRHDKLSLDRDVITLQSGGETVARITRIDDGIASEGRLNQPLGDDLGDGKLSAPEPLYKGRRESEWRQVYEVETELLARLEAAEALLNLASPLPAEQQIDRIIKIGSEIVQSNYGDASLLFAVQVTHSGWGLTYKRWRDEPENVSFKPYQIFISQAHNQIQQLPPLLLAQRLAAEVLAGSEPRSAFASWLLRFAAKKSIKADSEATEILLNQLDVPLSGIDRAAICLLIRAEYIHDELPVRQDLVDNLNELIVQLNETPATEFRDDMRQSLLKLLAERENRYGLHLNKIATAKLVFDGGKERTLLHGISGPTWIPNINRLYRPSSVTDARERIAWFLDGWVAVVNDFLESRRTIPYDRAVRDAVWALERVLWLYSDEDEWPVERTASLLTDQVRTYYTSDPNEGAQQTAEDLLPLAPANMLALIVHIKGEIPDFVRTGRPKSASVKLKLQRLETLLSSEPNPKAPARDFDDLQGLLAEAPYEVVRLSLRYCIQTPQIVARGLYVPLNPTELLYATSSQDDDRNNRNRPPTDPLLLVAILADLTGQSEDQDERIASLFTESSSKVMLSGPLYNILSGRLKAREHVRRLLEKMAATSKSQALIDAIGDLDATLFTSDPENRSPSEDVDTLEGTWSRALRAQYIYHRILQISDPRRLRDQKVIESLALHGDAIKDEDLVFLSTQSGLRELSLVDTAMDGTGLRNLAGLNELRRLSLVGPNVTDEWLENIPELTGLTNLGLSFTSVTDEGLQSLKKFPNLEGLSLNDTQIGDEGLEILQHLPALTSLSLKRAQVSDAGLLQLRHAPNLESFSLASPYVHGPGLTHVQNLKNLRTLQFVGPSVTDDWMHPVEPLRNVEWLELHGTSVTAAGLAAISRWTNLKRLYLNNNPIHDEVVAHLKDLYRLSGVELKRTNVTPEGLARLREALPDAGISGGTE